ncbi:hypothetical protein C4585_03020 [Candidatus Parcubacteria bacterium]|nr:MAG: hypothetical protein C4585_03020 [Candidatus Parcubacteria bacterium]
MNSNTYSAWIVLGSAVCAWVAVGFFAWSIENTVASRMEGTTEAQQQEIERISTARLHAVARETVEERAALQTAANLDVISIVEAIEAVGDVARVEIEIGQALADTAETSNGVTRSVNTIIEGEGAFANLLHAASLLYSLPIPSEVKELQLERVPANEGKIGWRLIVHMRVLTTVEIST